MSLVRRWSAVGVLALVCCRGREGSLAPAGLAPVPAAAQAASGQPPLPAETDAPRPVDFSEVAEPNEAARVTVPRGEAAPGWCTALAAHTTRLAAPSACATPDAARSLLAQAVRGSAERLLATEQQLAACDLVRERQASRVPPTTERQLIAQDAALAKLEACAGLPPGFVRALRANLTLPCADALAANYRLEPSLATARYHNTLLGLSLLSRFSRREFEAPPFRAKSLDPDVARHFIEHELLPWLTQREQALAADALLVEQVPEHSYGGALARLAFLGLRQRLLRAARGVSIPDDWKKDFSARQSFYARQLELMAPFYARALPFNALAAHDIAGLMRSTPALHVTEALRATRRSPLELLLLPPAPLPRLDAVPSRLAAALPPFFTAELLSTAELGEPEVLRAALLQGLAPAARQALATATLSAESRELLVRAHLVLALISASPTRALKAGSLARRIEPGSAELRLLRALSDVMAAMGDDNSFRDANAPLAAPNVEPLLQLAQGGGLLAAAAAFDAHAFSLLPGTLTEEARHRADGYAKRGAELLPAGAPRACVNAALGISLGLFPHCACPLAWHR